MPRGQINKTELAGLRFGLESLDRSPMSALGQKRTWQRILLMSALPPKADMDQSSCDVCFVPKADSCMQQKPLYSITSSAIASSDCGMASPSAFAVVRLTTRSNFVGCSTGRSAGATGHENNRNACCGLLRCSRSRNATSDNRRYRKGDQLTGKFRQFLVSTIPQRVSIITLSLE